MQKHSFAHTFRAKIKHGRLKKGGASSVNPKKEHHHRGAVCHGILASHPRRHRHCPLCRHCRCSPANLVTVSIALSSSPSLSLATLITATVVAAAITLIVTRPALSLPSPLLLPPSPAPSSSLATLIAVVIALFIASAFTCPPPSSPAGIILLADRRR